MADLFSFTAADTLPVKLLKDEKVVRSINRNKVIPPVHVQFMPTNKCNLSCPFCSCVNEDRTLEMSLSDAKKIIDICKNLGTRAATITGGGSPCLHPKINEIIDYFIESGIEVGLVDNGLALDKIDPHVLNRMTWCRISHADFRQFSAAYETKLRKHILLAPRVDWAFSYVVSKSPNIQGIISIINFANENNFTHIRLVADLFTPDEIDLGKIRQILTTNKVKDDKVIYQNRDVPSRGGDCYICYLKPVISADCKVYTCCGAQYYLKDAPKKMPYELCLGSAFDLKKIIANSHKPVNGHVCEKCYYKNYNDYLKAMMRTLQHENFL